MNEQANLANIFFSAYATFGIFIALNNKDMFISP